MSVLTVHERRAEVDQLAQVSERLARRQPRISNDEGRRLWEHAAREREACERKARLALAITEEGQSNRMRGRFHGEGSRNPLCQGSNQARRG